MAIELVGLLNPGRGSEERGPANDPFDADFVAEFAQVYDRSGYDRVLIGQNARSPDPITIASWALARTERLKVMIAHRPGFIAPTLAARMLATLDKLSKGRVGVHIITAASDAETRNDGDFLTKTERYHRSHEYVGILRQIWSATKPVDHSGDYYRHEGALSAILPDQPAIPIFWGGSSELGIRYGAELADVYALGGGAIAQVRQQVDTVKAEAAKLGRWLRYSMSMRLILGETEAAAWDRAQALLRKIEERQAAFGLLGREIGENQDKVVQSAREADRAGEDPYLWTELTQATRGRTQIMCLVGTPDQMVEALTGYYHAGIDNFLITGFDPVADAEWIGREIGPALRQATGAFPRDTVAV